MANTKVTGDVIANGTISTVHIADDAITAAKLDSTATGITFADLAVDTDTLYVDSTNNRVGIGTTSPLNKFDLRGTAYVTGYTAGFDTSPQGNYAYRLTNDGANSFINVQGGNLGIGVTSPGGKLEVKAANTGTTTDYATKVIKANAPLVGGYSGTKIVSLLSGFDSTIYAVDFGYGYNGTGYDLMLSTNDNLTGNPIERMRIDSSGNVGIGTTSLTSTSGYGTLSINGTTGGQIAFQTSGAGKHYIYSTATDFDIYNGQAGNLKLYTNATERMRITSGGDVQARRPRNNTAGQVALSVQPTDTVAHYGWRIDQTNNNLNLDYVNTPLNIMSYTTSGNVGIGTDSPTTNYPLTLRSRSGDYTKILDWGTDVGGSWGTMQISITAPYATELRSGAWNFAQGNVGIGETSPDTALDVVGGNADSVVNTLTLKNDNTGNSAGTGINFVVDGANDVVTSAIYGQRTAAAYHQGSLQFLTRDSSGGGLLERMRIDSSGNIRIGPSTTSSQIDFNYNNTNNKGGFSINYNTGEFKYYAGESTNGYYKTFYTNGVERMRITSGGNIGIGATGPVSKFEVRENLNSTNFTGITVTNSEGGGSNLSRAGIAFKAYDWVQSAIWHGRNMADGNQGALVLGTNPNTTDLTVGGVVGRMWIVNNGNVGIGTASPSATLDVDDDNTGKIRLLRNGSTRVELSNNANEGELSLYRSSTAKTIYISSYYNSYFNGGNVGIGTTLPIYPVVIASRGPSGNENRSLVIGNTNTNGTLMYFGSSASTSGYNEIQSITTENVSYGDLILNRIAGNVGIGTHAPETKLDVAGGVKAQTVEYSWHRSNPITSTNSYRHYKTTLYGGSGGNTMHIMGGFTLKAYSYSSNGYGEGSAMFHNWSGILYNLSVTNRGAWSNFVRSPYMSSDGYVVIVCEHDTYSQPIIDFYQFYTPYGWRSVSVSGDTTSNSLTGAY